jgi:hypothetical protein
VFRKRFLSGEQFSPAELSYKNASFFYEFASLLQRCFARATFLLQANKFDSVSGTMLSKNWTLELRWKVLSVQSLDAWSIS